MLVTLSPSTSKKLFSVSLLDITLRLNPITKVVSAAFELKVRTTVTKANDIEYGTTVKYELDSKIQKLIDNLIQLNLVLVNQELLNTLKRVETECKYSQDKNTNFWYQCDTLQVFALPTPLEFSLLIDYPNKEVVTELNQLITTAFLPVLLEWNK
jgi:hypothetical protein